MFFLGYMWLCIMGIQFLGTFGITNLLKLAGTPLRLKLFFTLLSLLFLLGLSSFKYLNNIFLFIICYLLLEWAKPYHRSLFLTLVYQHTSNNGRVTILSLENLASKLGNSLGLVISAWLIRSHGVAPVWLATSMLYALIVPGYLYLIYSEATTVALAGKKD